MSLTILNNVAETTTTTGTGSYLLAGVVSAGYRPFGDGGNGAVIPYKIENADKTKSEWGLGTYDSGGNTLARTTILGNYLGTTAAINWTSGTKNIYSPPLKELLTWSTFNSSGDVSAIKLAESSAPSTPASGFASVYVKTDGKLYLKDDAGTETDLTAGSTLDSLSDVVITSAASGQIIRHNGTNWVNASLATAGIQPLDATLTALAGLTIAANSLTIGTGADAFSQTTFSANTFPARASTGDLVAKTITDFALTILDDSDASSVRSTIGAGTGNGDALVANTLDQFADVTQTSGKTLAITDNTTLAGGTHSGTNTGDQASVSGNAGTATALQTARTINGTSFDGTANITITAAAGTLTGTTLNATVVTSSLTSVGTISSGTWEGTIIGPTFLGTGSSITTKFLRGDGTWQTIPGGGDALTSSSLAQFAATTSAELRGVLSDEKGTGAAIFDNNTSQTLITPILGTPTSGTLTNCTGLPQAGTVGLTTSDSPQFAGINLGHASDTTITRTSAGVIAVEGVDVVTTSTTQTLTNKTLTAPTIAASTMSGSHEVTGRIYTNLDTLTDGATITVDFSLGNKFTVTLGGNRTIAFSNDVAGQVIAIRLKQDGTGSRTITWPAGISWAGGSAPTLTATANKADWIMIVPTTAGSAYDGAVLSQNH